MNYRSTDEPFGARLIDRLLADRLGKDMVFLDNRTIPLGVAFEPVLLRRLRTSDALLVVIGRRWLRKVDGRRAIDDENDWVRREIVEALNCGILVIPVLMGEVTLPKREELPEDIRVISSHEYHLVGVKDPESDVDRLVERLAEQTWLRAVANAQPGAAEGEQEGAGRSSQITVRRVRNTGAMAIGTGASATSTRGQGLNQPR
ncbi:MAG: toll/interleukin-1 receptor domain-containing protein [Micromonosporaceae bacterium]|nr:toll/interleukin-1 receptor domain-containing protein [Micromonosporaceae bacterium]